ncbi:MAG: peptidylprolyl isomerase [Defluviitaleaceae bacterium]|nr:peptidylprolyl isomerase [Defluviitaleaceae bacterium]
MKFLTIAALALLIACGTANEYESTNNGEEYSISENGTATNEPIVGTFTPAAGSLTVLAHYGDINIYEEEFQYLLNIRSAAEANFLLQMGLDEESLEDFWEDEADPVTGITHRQRIHEETWEEVLEMATLRYIALSRGYEVTPELELEAQRNLDDFAEIVSAGGDDPEEHFYEMAGISLGTFSLIQPNILVINEFLMSLVDSVEVTEAQALQYFEENRETVERDLQMLVSAVHILVDTREEAEELLARLNAGERARDLAPIYSQDPGVVQDEGAYHFSRGEMVPEFEDWSFSANIGDTGIVESQFGYHVMYLEGRETLQDSNHMEHLMMLVAEPLAMEEIERILEEANLNFVINYDLLNSISF